MIEPTLTPSSSNSRKSMPHTDFNSQFPSYQTDSNANIAKVISPYCVRIGNLENFPTETLPESLSFEDIPGDDSSLISLLNDFNNEERQEPSEDNQVQKAKKRKVNSSPCGHEITSLNSDALADTSFSLPSIIPNSYNPSIFKHNRRLNFNVENYPKTIQQNEVNEQIIIIEPNLGHGLDNVTSKFFSNDILFSKNLEASLFGTIKDLNVTKNVTKQMYVLKFPPISKDNLSKLLEVNKLGVYHIKCRLPRSFQFSRGVIGPIGLETTDEELNKYLTENYPDITSARRFKKGTEKTPTQSILIEFNTDNLPEFLKIGYQRFKVRTYVPHPWQCYNCQRFGHNASDCKSKSKCMFCANNHKSESCPLKKEQSRISETNLKCANCNGNHTANFGGCNRIKEAKTVEKIRAHHRLSYRDALKTAKSNVPNPIPLSGTDNSFFPDKNTASQPHSSGYMQQISRGSMKTSVNASSQTENSNKCENTELVKNISVMIIKVIGCLTSTCAMGDKIGDILEVVKNVMGVDVSGEVIGSTQALFPSMNEQDGNTSNSSKLAYKSDPTNKKMNSTLNKPEQRVNVIGRNISDEVVGGSQVLFPSGAECDENKTSSSKLTYDSHPTNRKNKSSPNVFKERITRASKNKSSK